MAASYEAAETPSTTGRRPAVCSTRISATRSRSSSIKTLNSLALTGPTTAWAPPLMVNSMHRRSESSSTRPELVKGVGGIAKTPRKGATDNALTVTLKFLIVNP